MSKPTDQRPNRYTQPGHAGAIGPAYLLGHVIGVSSYLILILLLSIKLLYTLWPGGQWVVAWYEGENRRAAATAVAEVGGKRLAETLDLLARLENANGKLLTTAQITKVNLDLVYAEELKRGALSAANPSLLAESPRAAPAPSRTLGSVQPTSDRLRLLREHITDAKNILLDRLTRAQIPPAHPQALDLILMRPPPPSDTAQAWQPLPSEAAFYAEAFEKSRTAQAPYFLGSSELNYLIIVFLFGVLGACLRSLASLTRYVGNRSFRPRWILYYLCQPCLGGGLAIAFYVVLRGGFMNTETSAANATNLYACSAFSVLVGASINEAMKKIQNIAGQFFATNEPDKDRVDQPRSDSTTPIIQDVQLRPGGRSGSVIGLRLNDATKLYLGEEKRSLEILASGPTSILFQVAPDESPLTQDDLRSVIVETKEGASAAHDDTTPDHTEPIIETIQLKPDGRSGTLTGARLNDARKLSLGADKRPLDIVASTPTSIQFKVFPREPALTPADLTSVIVETPAGPSSPYDAPTP